MWKLTKEAKVTANEIKNKIGKKYYCHTSLRLERRERVELWKTSGYDLKTPHVFVSLPTITICRI